ncbi:MAG: hypothetical protein AB4368_03280 [Xenococcaceae cyanobacterium]
MTSILSPSIPQEILDSLTAIKGVFASAKGPRVLQLQQDVNRIEEYILSRDNIPNTSVCSQDPVDRGSERQKPSEIIDATPSANPPSIACFREISEKVNLGVINCEETLAQLRILQKNTAIALENINYLTTEYQEANRLITLMEKVQESLEILSVNTAIQATQQNSEDELVTIAQQVESISSQTKTTATHIKEWIKEIKEKTKNLNQSITPTETDLDTLRQNIVQIRQNLQEIMQIII